MSSKEPRPLPKPGERGYQSSPPKLASPPPPPKRYDVTRSQALSLAEHNAELQARVTELERDNADLLADSIHVSDQLKRTQYRLHAISEKANRIQRAWKEYRSVAAVADKIRIDQLNTQLKAVVSVNHDIATDNARLRELLRRVAPFVPIENPLTPELRKELDK